jgi:hypothetical protein
MELNPLRRVLTAKAPAFFGLALLVAVVMLVIASMDSVGQAGAAQKKKSPSQRAGLAPKRLSLLTVAKGSPSPARTRARAGRSSSRLQGPGTVSLLARSA